MTWFRVESLRTLEISAIKKGMDSRIPNPYHFLTVSIQNAYLPSSSRSAWKVSSADGARRGMPNRPHSDTSRRQRLWPVPDGVGDDGCGLESVNPAWLGGPAQCAETPAEGDHGAGARQGERGPGGQGAGHPCSLEPDGHPYLAGCRATIASRKQPRCATSVD